MASRAIGEDFIKEVFQVEKVILDRKLNWQIWNTREWSYREEPVLEEENC